MACSRALALCLVAGLVLAQDKEKDKVLTTVADLGAAYDKHLARIKCLKAGMKMFKSSKTVDTSWFLKGTLYYKTTEQETQILLEERVAGPERNSRHLWKRSTSTMLSVRLEDKRYSTMDLSDPAAAFFYPLVLFMPFSELEKIWEIQLTETPAQMPGENDPIEEPGDYVQDRPEKNSKPRVFQVREARDRYVVTLTPRSSALRGRIHSVQAALHPRRFVWTALTIEASSYKAIVHLYGFDTEAEIPDEKFALDLRGFKKDDK